MRYYRKYQTCGDCLYSTFYMYAMKPLAIVKQSICIRIVLNCLYTNVTEKSVKTVYRGVVGGSMKTVKLLIVSENIFTFNQVINVSLHLK